MARTIDDAVTEARVILEDTETPYRYSDSELVRYLNNSFAEMRRVRPDLFVGLFITQLPTFTVSQFSSSYPLPDMYYPATVSYMVAMSNMRDDQDVLSGRASSFLQLFTAQMGLT